MLTNTHFIFLAIAFMIFIVLGVFLRVIYNSNTTKESHIRIKNILILTIVFPVIAFKELTKHKTDFIRNVNRNDNLTEVQKQRLKKKLSSNTRVLMFVIYNSIRRFKEILDMHVNLLNSYREKHGEELKVSLRIRIDLKRNNIKKDFYKDKISGLFA